MATVDQQIDSAASAISANITSLAHDRALLAQNILGQLRNLVEGVAVRLHAGRGDIEFDYSSVGAAMSHVGGYAKLNFLRRFHKLLQISSSHYTLGGDPSERLMLKYYDYLLRIRDLCGDQLGLTVLGNLEDFPVDLDPSLEEYHQKIAQRIAEQRSRRASHDRRDRYYIHAVRPFFTGGRVYYEVTFYNAVNRVSKFDRIIGFTDIDISENYAANLLLESDSIDVLGQTMPITFIREWEVSIRPCEFDNFARLIGKKTQVNSGSAEYRGLMQYLTRSGGTLLDLLDMPDAQFNKVRTDATERARSRQIFPLLEQLRGLVRANAPGSNVLRYLMLRMNNQIIKLQYSVEECRVLSDLNLEYGCKPFDTMPFCTSLFGHNPRFSDLAASLDSTGRTHEFLARRVKTNVEDRAMLYTPVATLEDLGDVDQLIATYNRNVYYKHTGRKLKKEMGHVFIAEYEDGTVAIIEKLQALASTGVAGYEF